MHKSYHVLIFKVDIKSARFRTQYTNNSEIDKNKKKQGTVH